MARSLAVLLFACFLSFAEDKARDFPSIPKHMFASTYRVLAYEDGKNDKYELWASYHASAVGIDLSAYGLTEPRYLLTCAHAAVDDGKKRSLQIEITKGSKTDWIDVKIVAFDEDSDLCLLKAESDIPFLASLSDGYVTDIGDAVVAVGCPHGSAITASLGYLASKKMANEEKTLSAKDWWQSSNSIFYGNSGGPIFDANTGKVIGITAAVISRDKAVAPNIALFAGLQATKKFVAKNAKKAISNAPKPSKTGR
jgi:S1-C subfamily serine protease